MRRTTPLTTAALLGLTVLGPAAMPAQAAGETCRGEAATIVGTGSTLTGTEGRDVIVTGPAGVVDALGGDDLICVTGSVRTYDVLSVVAGAGNDLVDTSVLAPGYDVTTILGAGADTFVGGRAEDTVYAGDQARTADGGYARGPDTEQDTIDTGEGNDVVLTGSLGTPYRDAVTLGPGADYLILSASTVTSEAALDGGAGTDRMHLTSGSGDVALDMTQGTFTAGQGTARFAGFEVTWLAMGAGTLTYRGTDGDDDVTVSPTDGIPALDLTTGGGDDEVTLEPAGLAAGSRIHTGAGHDKLVAATETGRLALDLPAQRLSVGPVDAVAVGLEDAFLMAPEVAMVGDDGDNSLMWNGCAADLRGGLGDDALRWQFDYVFESYEFSCEGEVSMNGGDGRDSLRGSVGDDLLIGGRGHDDIEGRNGDDRIRGSRGNDTVDGGEGRDHVSGGSGNDVINGRAADDALIGGPGRDRVDGSRGRDRCVAERKARCER